jgi:hypothetical protein
VPEQVGARPVSLLLPRTRTATAARAGAPRTLYGSIFHQGSRYEATAYAVPFLARLALDPRTLQRDVIVHLLVALAIGYDEAYQPAGVDVAGWRAGVERSPAPVRPRLDPGRLARTSGTTAFPIAAAALRVTFPRAAPHPLPRSEPITANDVEYDRPRDRIADLALHGMRVVLLRAQRQTGLICACLPSCQFWRAFRFLSVLVTFTAYLSRNVRQN